MMCLISLVLRIMKKVIFMAKPIKKLFLYLGLNAVLFYLIIANGNSNPWYIAPAYPVISIIMSLTIYYLFDVVINFSKIKYPAILACMVIFFLFLICLDIKFHLAITLFIL